MKGKLVCRLGAVDFLLYEKKDGMECVVITDSRVLIQQLRSILSSLQYDILTIQQSWIEFSTPKAFEQYIGNIDFIKHLRSS